MILLFMTIENDNSELQSAETADLLAELVAYLDSKLDDIKVATEVPDKRPDVLVILNRAGGELGRFTENQRFTVDAWHTSDIQAAWLIQTASDYLIDAPLELVNVVSVVTDSIYRSDVDDAHRWSATVEVFANRP